LLRLDLSFPRERRLKKAKEIVFVFKKGKREEARYFSFFWRKNSLDYDRFAVVVNKKFGKSVERNRVKRRMREIFRLERKGKGIDIVVYLKKSGKHANFQDLRNEFKKCLNRIK